MIAVEDRCIEGIERRGRVYYMRWRVPVRYAPVERRKEINRSLKTRDFEEAKARLIVAKRGLMADWDLCIAERRGETSVEAFDAALEMLREIGLSFQPKQQLLSEPIEKLLDRIEALDNVETSSVKVPAVLGLLDFPAVNISKMPAIIEEINQLELSAKNGRQLDEWNNKYKHAAKLRQKLGGRSRSSIYRDIKSGRLPMPAKVGSRLYWDETEVRAAIEMHRLPQI
ncbi:DUF6538 domain-containing protein [Ruegeria sp. SCP11]|uniref:DUF6538 domain-containing protein n=1 Tax=Ruegeria sp. SCP11 TaxID=3141378 RepID=UPI00333B815F